nr:MAG TPA: Pumilio-family RNA binding repeat [Caudoviricetes sp.]
MRAICIDEYGNWVMNLHPIHIKGYKRRRRKKNGRHAICKPF